MKQIKWGIIGLGNIAKIFSESFANIKNSKLIAIASKDPSKIEQFKNQFNINPKLCFDNYDELICRQEVDAIYIALPNSLHFEWIKKCLESKKHVLTEKPCTINYAEIENINKLISSGNFFFAEALHYRYLPQMFKLIELLKENIIGELLSMESVYGHNLLTKRNIFGFIKKKRIKKNNRLFSKQLGGGSILDIGCYPVSLSTLIASLIPSVKLEDIILEKKNVDYGELEVDIDSYLELNFSNRFRSSIGVSYKQNLGKYCKIVGTKGEIKITDTWHGTPSVILVFGKKNKEIILNTRSNIYSYQTEFVSNCILNESKKLLFPGPSVKDSLRNIKILELWKN